MMIMMMMYKMMMMMINMIMIMMMMMMMMMTTTKTPTKMTIKTTRKTITKQPSLKKCLLRNKLKIRIYFFVSMPISAHLKRLSGLPYAGLYFVHDWFRSYG